MFTRAQNPHTRRFVRCGPIFVLLVASVVALGGAAAKPGPRPAQITDLDGRDSNQRDSLKPKITATFPSESYGPGQKARLLVYSSARRVTLQFFRAGLEPAGTTANDVMLGGPLSKRIWVGAVRPGRVLHVRIGDWASGLYFARLTATGGRIGYAPFVLRPSRLGEHRVAVVMPSQTWQAYNFRDDDGNGSADTWYAGGPSARLGRPFLNRGVPYHYKYYDAPFLRWLAHTGHEADYLADADLNAVRSGRQLARDYALIIFPGHHEYVTTHEYDVTIGYRNLGGNLMFLSANNFFWKIVKHGKVMERVARWRDIGRPEAAMIGVQYFHNDLGEHRGRYVVRTPIPWLFAGTGLHKGSLLSSAGIEADRVYPSSPRGVQVVAEIPNLYGPGMTAQMTYYERGGAKVFAAGAFTMAAAIGQPTVKQMVANLWNRLASDEDTGVSTLKRTPLPGRAGR